MDVIQLILDQAVARLKDMPGIQAVVLGGSRARGTQRADSDIDIGIYYDGEARLDLPALEDAAGLMDDGHRKGLIAPPGKWGKWVNGGGWLIVHGRHVDFILRDLRRVEAVIRDCQAGVVSAHYHVGHPHAYINAMYRGELAVSRLFWDATGKVARLKAVAEVYPPKLKTAISRSFLFEAEFSYKLAADYAQKEDLYYVTAHLVRAVSCLNQVLFAVNEQYCINEKKAVQMADAFPVKPQDYKSRVDDIFAQAGRDLSASCAILGALIDEVRDIASR